MLSGRLVLDMVEGIPYGNVNVKLRLYPSKEWEDILFFRPQYMSSKSPLLLAGWRILLPLAYELDANMYAGRRLFSDTTNIVLSTLEGLKLMTRSLLYHSVSVAASVGSNVSEFVIATDSLEHCQYLRVRFEPRDSCYRTPSDQSSSCPSR